MISTRQLSKLANPETLERSMKATAALDALILPEWQYRYFSFDASWANGERMASIRNGSGDDLYVVFMDKHFLIVGCSHEYAKPSKLLEHATAKLPHALIAPLKELAFSPEQYTYIVWWNTDTAAWESVETSTEDGSEMFLALLDGNPETYRTWANEYYEIDLTDRDVRQFFAHQIMNDSLLVQINPKVDPKILREEWSKMGFPDSR